MMTGRQTGSSLSRLWELPASRAARPQSRWGLVRLGLALAAAGYLVFCHGCHGDEDNELWVRLTGRESGSVHCAQEVSHANS